MPRQSSQSLLRFLCFVLAPVNDLRQALKKGRLDELNPIPWAVMTGNCLGWAAYGYYTKDPFVLAANLPGIVLSLWLNLGASKLQYCELRDELKASGESSASEEVVVVPQEKLLLRVLVGWSVVLVYVGWIQRSHSPATIVGLCVNVNLGKLLCERQWESILLSASCFFNNYISFRKSILLRRSSRGYEESDTSKIQRCHPYSNHDYELDKHDLLDGVRVCSSRSSHFRTKRHWFAAGHSTRDLGLSLSQTTRRIICRIRIECWTGGRRYP